MEPTTSTSPSTASSRLTLAYVAPMILFMVMTSVLEANFPAQYVWLYIAKVLVVSTALVIFRVVWKDIRPETRVLLPAIAVGLAVFVMWIAIDPYTPALSFLGKRTALDPFIAIPDPLQRGLFLTFRFFGLVLMVPVMEELFWRSFLLRWITDPDYERIPLGHCSSTAFLLVTVAFGFAHNEWLAAILCGAAYAFLLMRTKSLFACVVAHAVTNLALGIYVLTTHAWKFW